MERSITKSEKRRDNKNRILRTGESQRKDGRYAYKYIDTFGKPQFVYSWKVVPTDKTPAGKRDDIALREKEKEIQKDLDDGIDHIGKKMTVCQLYAKQIRHRANVRHGTKQGRKQLMRILQEDKLGACRIENVKLSDAKEWALRMKEKGYDFKTINNHKRSLKAAFYTAIQDDCVVRQIKWCSIRQIISCRFGISTDRLVILKVIVSANCFPDRKTPAN